jgi:hypothetical protein
MADVLPMRPVDPRAFSGDQPQQTPPDMTQEGMMQYLMEKVKELRSRMGNNPQAERGALEALMKMMDKNSAMDGTMPKGSMRDGQRTYFENPSLDRAIQMERMAPMTARNPNPNMDMGMARNPNALKPNRGAGEV